jgi:hypothetical protein
MEEGVMEIVEGIVAVAVIEFSASMDLMMGVISSNVLRDDLHSLLYFDFSG